MVPTCLITIIKKWLECTCSDITDNGLIQCWIWCHYWKGWMRDPFGGHNVPGSMLWEYISSLVFSCLAICFPAATNWAALVHTALLSFCDDGLLQNDEVIWQEAVASEIMWEKWNLHSLRLIFSGIRHSNITLLWLLTWQVCQNKAATGGSHPRRLRIELTEELFGHKDTKDLQHWRKDYKDTVGEASVETKPANFFLLPLYPPEQ